MQDDVVGGRAQAGRGAGWTALAVAAARVRADLAVLVVDVIALASTYCLVLLLRFDAEVPATYWSSFRSILPALVALHLVANAVTGLYGQVWRHASVAEARRVVRAGLGGAVLVVAAAALAGGGVIPLSVALSGAVIAPGVLGTVRFQTRLFALRRRDVEQQTRVVVVGAGDIGGGLIRDMHHQPELGLLPVAALDDDLALIGRRIGDVTIEGPIELLPAVVRRTRADHVILAIAGADGQLVRRVAALADEAGVHLRVMPGIRELVRGAAGVRDVRDVQIEDLLGRQAISTDLDGVRAAIRGKRVLVTGAGGSIGSEVLAQVAALEPAALIALDQDETHLFDAAAAIGGRCTQVLADIRDAARIDRVFAEHRPQVVFHAAALKHVPILEAHPTQAVATNVLGTEHVVRAAAAVDVERVVLISTDKAVNPTSVMGATKHLAEQLLLAHAPAGRAWCAVRFGNVLGSRGSVVPTFMRQIAAGGPVTVTDPQMTRFFMSIPEAVELVLQAAALSDGRDLFMLDMGEPVRILDLAERMIRLSGREPGVDIPIQITGVRPGEKLHEELRTGEEAAEPTAHPSVLRVQPTTLDRAVLGTGVEALAADVRAGDDAAARAQLGLLVRGAALSAGPDHLEVRVGGDLGVMAGVRR